MIRPIAAVVLVAASATSWGQASIDLASPGGDSFSAGQIVTLDLSGSNWSVGTPLDGGGLDLAFNPAVLSLQSVTVNTGTFDAAAVFPTLVPNATIDNSAGTATGIEFFTFLNPSPSGDFSIANLTFVANSAGSANFSLTENAIGLASNGASLSAGVDFAFQTADVKVSSGMVSPVPEPSTFWLIAVITVLAFAMRRRLFGESKGLAV